ncbi:hypothetical protein Droror1_Dr00023798 [Drosera rotundifolia]
MNSSPNGGGTRSILTLTDGLLCCASKCFILLTKVDYLFIFHTVAVVQECRWWALLIAKIEDIASYYFANDMLGISVCVVFKCTCLLFFAHSTRLSCGMAVYLPFLLRKEYDTMLMYALLVSLYI